MQLLTLENINKRIKKQQILKDISFTLKQGEVVGLVGANGAGKTTLMKVILGLSNYQSGSLKLHGSMNNKHIGALIENPGVYPFLTGYENMNLINEDKDKENMEQIIKNLEMTPFINKKAKAYSLGMKQKLGIVLSLLNQPQLVILDEPMNGLDPKAVRNVRETILRLKAQGVSFLISSHMLSELVKVTDSILIIDNGAIVKETTMEELNNSNESDLENVLLNIIDHKEERK
ncbi:lantibiotic ABC transporter ATP-binding protein [Staphylococcus equorum]|uniref:ABC transporter ATP-binding protein n=1 Tax=Staphylococcus equorum TaxID=246432 RepID=UPI000853A780|nr:ATP-binding cassette domain-containing protein [Staphylococcus equorum]MDG0822940.1 ATP-binding cassette domain-containing protein [Staphylococcus equorum]MDG0836560.1 ATP-binding cassette domain-containing protein [Staphylococcus equorum]OEK66947.1 lantibiotic ABC transporter ATP-binding protein [Staphylococcus equorum]